MNDEEQERFQETLLPHLDAAYNLARYLTGDDHSAQDVVQEAFCRAARFFAGYRGGDARSWLLAVVRRAAYDHGAKRSEPTASFDENHHGRADESLNPESIALRRADRERVRRELEALPEELREVIVLRELEGLSYQQIAAVTGSPVGTVMSRLSRARGRLQQRLARCPGEEG